MMVVFGRRVPRWRQISCQPVAVRLRDAAIAWDFRMNSWNTLSKTQLAVPVVLFTNALPFHWAPTFVQSWLQSTFFP
eukprot:COSAG03_NODE_9228_length_736_cov_30.788069_2_plen_77_part_00